MKKYRIIEETRLKGSEIEQLWFCESQEPSEFPPGFNWRMVDGTLNFMSAGEAEDRLRKTLELPAKVVKKELEL